GRLILSAAQNQQLVDKLLGRMKLINCTLQGSVRRSRLNQFPLATTARRERFEPQGGVEIAKIVPGIGVDLVDEHLREAPDERDKEKRPLAVQAGCGLGRVILIGCDLDAP